MLRVGLTGGAGSGKSTVAALLENRDAVIIDTDVIAREVVQPGQPALAAVVEHFGPWALRADGSLDREAVANRVFASDEDRRALEGILHPLVRQEVFRRSEPWEGTGAVVVWVVPLLVESGRYPADTVVVVDCPDELAVERMIKTRGWAREQAVARLRAQADRSMRLAAADHVIDNGGSIEELHAAVALLWDVLRARSS